MKNMKMWLISVINIMIMIDMLIDSMAYASEYEMSSFDCETDMDCSLLGDCDKDTKKCVCDPGWTGDHCEKVNLLPIGKNKGFINSNYPSWGMCFLFLLSKCLCM